MKRIFSLLVLFLATSCNNNIVPSNTETIDVESIETYYEGTNHPIPRWINREVSLLGVEQLHLEPGWYPFKCESRYFIDCFEEKENETFFDDWYDHQFTNPTQIKIIYKNVKSENEKIVFNKDGGYIRTSNFENYEPIITNYWSGYRYFSGLLSIWKNDSNVTDVNVYYCNKDGVIFGEAIECCYESDVEAYYAIGYCSDFIIKYQGDGTNQCELPGFSLAVEYMTEAYEERYE